MAETISTIQMAQQLGNPQVVVIDVRPMAAYNGWQLQGEARGGHIRGAVACPLSWTGGIEPADLKMLLQSKGITQDRTVVVYGYMHDDGTAMATKLSDLGHEEVLAYEASLTEWASDLSLPMSRLANYEKLVHSEWLNRLISEGHAETYPGKGFVIFHVNSGAPEDYEKGHIPGAMYLNTYAFESASTRNRLPDEYLEAALLAHGITHNKTIVLYGRDSLPDTDKAHPARKAGQIAATRAAAILMYSGVEDVRLLDGGFDAWVTAGYEVETEGHKPTPAKTFGAPIPGHPDYFIDIEEVRALIADPEGVVVSIRSWPEYIGQTSGYHYIKRTGRIAGAVWGMAGSDAYHMQHFRNVDNTMRDYHEIEANWRESGITPNKQVAFYCGTGWRASEAFFSAYLMGWPNIAVYDGSWFEWSQDEANPIESGAI